MMREKEKRLPAFVLLLLVHFFCVYMADEGCNIIKSLHTACGLLNRPTIYTHIYTYTELCTDTYLQPFLVKSRS